MITRIGICSILGGIFVFIFSGVSSFMEAENFWSNLTITKLMGEERAESIITGFESEMIQNVLDTLFYDIPFFGILISLGVILLVISMFIKDT